MKRLIGVLGVSIALFTTQANAQTQVAEGTRLGVIVAMEKANVAGTDAQRQYSDEGGNVGTQIGANLGGFVGAFVGWSVGAIADRVYNQAQTHIDGYNVKVRFDDGSTMWRARRADQIKTENVNVGSRVLVRYTNNSVSFQPSDEPLPANIPEESSSASSMQAWEGAKEPQGTQMTSLDAPSEGITISVNRK